MFLSISRVLGFRRRFTVTIAGLLILLPATAAVSSTATASGPTRSGTVVAWGSNVNGQASVPSGLTNVTAVSAGEYNSLALRSDGTVIGWGYVYPGDNGIPMPTDLSGVTAISAGSFHNLALKSNGTVVGWGDNLGQKATPPTGLGGVVAISAGNDQSLALKSDGKVVGWGFSVYGDSTPSSDLSNVTAIAAGGFH